MAGRKRIERPELGERKYYSFFLYPYEYQELKILYNKLKAKRKQFELKSK